MNLLVPIVTRSSRLGSRLTAMILFGIAALSIAAAPKPKKEVFIPMDYSTCGYYASERPLPDVAIGVYVPWQKGDCAHLIQQAIDQVSRLRPDASGHRGAVLLGEGRFRIDTPLRIHASGVVLRGMGRLRTVIEKHGTDRGAMIYMEGSSVPALASPDTIFITSEKIPAGSTKIMIANAVQQLQAVTRITIVRPCTKQWIDHLGMGDFGGGLDYTGWKPTDIDIRWDRTVTAVNADTLILDAPLTTTISSEYGGAYILKERHDGELSECGVENLTLESAVNDWNPKDEDHCWDGIYAENVRDCWVRRVTFRHLAGSAVTLQLHTSRVTVEDCLAEQPVSEVGGWRRQVFLTRGQQTLFQRCISRQGIHDFAAGYCAAGPSAFVQCEGEESLGFSGSIGSWAAGLLFDIVNIDGHDLRFANLEQYQFGTGWNTANSMFWQCTASTVWCYSPDDDNRSSGHGCWGTLTGNGEWTSSNDHVQPRSLFYHQLQQRLQPSGSSVLDGFILPRSLNATTSPTVDEAMAMARESLEEPRLTMQMWQDSVEAKNPIIHITPTNTIQPVAVSAPTTAAVPIGITNGHITHGGLLITGNQYNIPWWSGRVKDNFVQREAKPAVTRFVPGREGCGWTDRIDSVVAFCATNHYSMLYHHYGLWYDLRRTDHERIRRADGDVWTPFYEQPFARSGQGTAWDGLSRYDVTRPNQWYWSRLRQFADKAAPRGILLFNNHYFQHNILEAGAHWVDCPWRPVNNINFGHNAPFPEPVPFAGDKRIFIAEQFYNEQDSTLRPLHQQYIRLCLDQLRDQPNAVHLISAEYTGPLHFTRFWLQTIAEWERQTGRHPMVALSCTRDAQDSILADPILSQVVDIIDIRYWHYNTDSLWAPTEGKNMAPRQWMRKQRVGSTGFAEAYHAVREMRQAHPDKAVTFFSQQYPAYGWAILMAGGSLPNVTINNSQLLADIPLMTTIDQVSGCVALGSSDKGYLIYALDSQVSIPLASGHYRLYTVDTHSGSVTTIQRSLIVGADGFIRQNMSAGQVLWLQRL